MSKKTVIKADLVGKKCMSEILAVVSTLEGIKSMEVDAEKCTLTVTGAVDPVRIAQKLKKKCFAASIVSVEDDKPKKKDPCKEVCEKLCKEKCEKVTCCKECKEKCEKACKEKCEKRCEAWLDKVGCCRSCCGGGCSCATTSPGCYYTPCAAPSYYPYYCYGSGWPWPSGC